MTHRTRGRGRLHLAILCLTAATLAHPLTALAQSDTRLLAAVRQAQEGQGDSARAAVQKLLTATTVTDTLYPQILYTQALIAPNAQDMQRNLQRVVVEYSSSSWVDHALVRLAQLYYATGDLPATTRTLERIRVDRPGSPIFPVAAYWAARAYFEQRNQTNACRWITEGLARVGNDVEIKNQLDYYQQRCATPAQAAATPAADSARKDSIGAPTMDPAKITPKPTTPLTKPAPDSAAAAKPTPTPTPTPVTPVVAPKPKPATTGFRVQIVAANTQAAADKALANLKQAGFDGVIVKEADYFKVRSTAYPTRTAAAAALEQIKAKLGGSPFIVAAQ